MSSDEFSAFVPGCVICGHDHRSVTMKKLHKPRIIEGETLTHWGICPDTGDPVFGLSREENDRRYFAGTLYDKPVSAVDIKATYGISDKDAEAAKG
jgi:hypothetical protein